MTRTRLVWALGAVALLGACRTTPLDNIWPGCCPPAPCAPPPCAPVVATCEAVPWSVEIDERISPAVDCNPVRTQHTLVATVRDQNGNPLPGQRVEWILARYPDAVGDIVAHDDQYGVGSIAPIRNASIGNAGNKIDNAYAISVTNYGAESIDAGNNHPYLSPDGARLPDITVNRGQSWLTITSGREGVTEIIVYVPAIRDGTRHKIWAKKIWADYDVVFPQDAVNTLPEGSHPFVVTVTRTNGSGIPGQPVEAEILDGPEAVFASTNARTARVDTDGQGLAQFTLRNTAGATGTNRVRFTALGSWYGETCPRSRIVTKRWQKPSLEVDCSFPEGGVVPAGRPFAKQVRVRNTGDAPAENVTLEDRPDAGLAIVEGGPFPLNLGTLAPGQEVVHTLRLVGESEGRFTNHVSVRDGAGGAQASNSCPVEIVVGRLEIAKRCEPTRVSNGGEVRFVVTVKNTGRGPLENVVVEDIYPEGIAQLSQSSAPLGTLASNETQEIEFVGRAERTGSFTNTATATADRAAPVQASCTVQVVECKLEMTLTGPDKIYYGEGANFTLTVRNVGDGEAEGCTVRVANGGCLGGGYQDFNVGPLAPGQAFTQDWAVMARTVGPCSVTAESSCGQRCAVKSEVATQVTGLPALQLEMTDKAMDGTEAGIFPIGSTFVYRLKVENDVGTDVTPEMYVQWALPAELEFVSGRSSRDGVTVTGTGTACRSSGFDLRVNEAMDFEIIVRVVGAPDAGMVRSVAEVRRSSDNTELASDTESTSLKR
jgi:uncharacterized repeat protein (TIGR01451 family)